MILNIFFRGHRLGTFRSPLAIPEIGDKIAVGDRSYVCTQRRWAFGDKGLEAIDLEVEE